MSMPNTNVTTSETSTLSSTSSNTTVVLILNSAYVPAQLTITAGTTVTWINKDSVGHTVTEGQPNSPEQPAVRAFDSSGEAGSGKIGLMESGQSWSYTFTTPGTYNYYCIVHPYMTGQVTVLPAGGSNGSQSPGYGELTNFEITLTGKDLLGISAFGIIVLVTLMVVMSRSSRRQEKSAV